MSDNALTGARKCVRVDESTNRRVVVAGLQVVEVGLVIVVVASVAEGVQVCKSAGFGQDIAPGVVGIAGDLGMIGCTVDPHHIALQILDKVVVWPSSVTCVQKGEANHTSAFVVGVVHVQADCTGCGVAGLTLVASVSNGIDDIRTIRIGFLRAQTRASPWGEAVTAGD